MSAVASAVIQSYHCGRAKFTLIFILRTHNCNLLFSGILRQRAMNSCGYELKHVWCARFKELRCGRLSPQVIDWEEILMVDYVKHIQLCEP